MNSRTLLERLTRLPFDSLLGALVRAPLKLVPRNRVMRVRSGLNEGASWIAGSSVHGCWLGTYEAEKQARIGQVVAEGMTVWDVGANVGFYSLALSRRVGSRGRVYAFEPLQANVERLREHLRLNDARNVVVVSAALGAKSGNVGFVVAPSNSMGHVSEEAPSCVVRQLSADDFLRDHPDAAPAFLKVDIEGAEADFLAGATRLLAAHRPSMTLALHGEPQRRRCEVTLRDAGYALATLDGNPLNPGDPCDELYAEVPRGGTAP